MMTARMLTPWFMRDHVWTRRHLSDFLDDELDAHQRGRVERHVHRCASCHRLLESLRRTVEGLRGLGHRTSPETGVAGSVIERLRGLPDQRHGP